MAYEVKTLLISEIPSPQTDHVPIQPLPVDFNTSAVAVVTCRESQLEWEEAW